MEPPSTDDLRRWGARRVEEGRWTGTYWQPVVSLPRSSNRTGPFRASGFPTDFTTGSRKSPKMDITQPKHAHLPEHNRDREPGSAARSHLVTMPEKIPHALIDVVIDRTISHQPRPVTEVVRPAPQNPVELISHLRPGRHVLAHQQVSHLLPQLGHALFRRTCPEILVTILPKTMRPEAVSQKIKLLAPCRLDAGLRLVQRESDPGHHTPRPIQCLRRAAATENHEIIGVVDHPSSENL